MKKCFIVMALAATIAAWAGTGKSESNNNLGTESVVLQTERKCLQCPNQKLEERLVTVGWKKCDKCNGNGWYGYGKTKEECRKNRSLCDPCNYCQGKGKQPIKDWRWVCPRCKAVYAK